MPKGLSIRSGSARVRIFASRSGSYVRHELRWTDHHGRKRRVKHSQLATAKREAKRIADDLARGHHRSELTLADLASFRAGVVNLIGTGKTLETVTAECAESLKILRAGLNGAPAPSFAELARFYLEHRPITLTDLTVETAVARCLDSKTQQGISPRWFGALKGQLRRFEADHLHTRCADLTAASVRQWAYNLTKRPRTGKPSATLCGARSRNNHLAAVKLLFQLAELRPHRERQAILDIPEIAQVESVNALWTPDEFRQLLTAASDELLPVLVLGGFAKIRASEIRRLTWSQVKLSENRVVIHAGQAKTKRWRIVPLPDCAVAWLSIVPADLRKADARVWKWGVQKFSSALRGLAKGCELQWRKNALRNSATTYDQIANPDVARVAREAGNSAAVLETEYFALQGISKETAEAWFDIMPPADRQRVIIDLKTARA